MTVCKHNGNNIHSNYNDDPITTDNNTETTSTTTTENTVPTTIDIPFDKIFLIVQDTVTGLKKLYINQIIYQKYSKLISMMTTITTTTDNENNNVIVQQQQRLIII